MIEEKYNISLKFIDDFPIDKDFNIYGENDFEEKKKESNNKKSNSFEYPKTKIFTFNEVKKALMK